MPDKQCPLCGSSANAGALDYGRKLQFLCKNCDSRFVITNGSENNLSGLDGKIKKSIILKAQECKPPLILHIYRDGNKNLIVDCKPESNFS